jgi:hypothetical protein
MNEYDFDRTARLWLDDGPSQMPDRALDAALATVHRTRQRRAFWPAWLTIDLTIPIRLAAGLAVVVIAIVGLSLLRGGSVGEPEPSPTPTPSPLPTLPPVALALNPGRWAAPSPFPVALTVTVPNGWAGNVGGPYAVFLTPVSAPGGVSITSFSKVYADPCHSEQGVMSPSPGPAADDLIAALRRVPSLTVSPVTDTTVSGHPAKELTIAAPASFAGCTLQAGTYRLWELPLGATNDMATGERQLLRIVDIDGTRYVIDLSQPTTESPAQRAEAQAVMDSIQIAP